MSSWAYPKPIVDESTFLQILDMVGKNVIVRSKTEENNEIHCDCYDPDYRTFDIHCPLCKGTGYSPNPYNEYWTTADVQYQPPPSLAGSDNIYTRIGDLKRDYISAYFRKDDVIATEDYIILEFLRTQTKEPPTYRVTQVRKYLGTSDNVLLQYVQMRQEVADTSGR